MLKILHIIPDSQLGGGNVNVARLAAALPPSVQSYFLVPSDAEHNVRDLFPSERLISGQYKGRGSLWKIARGVRVAAPTHNVIHAHGSRAAAGALIAGLLGASTPLLYTVRGYHGLLNPDKFRIHVLAERILARSFNTVVFVSKSDHDAGLRYGLRYRRTALIPNGVSLPPAPQPTQKRFDVVFVGRSVYQKDPHAFIETVRHIPRTRKIAMISDGPFEKEISDLIAFHDLQNISTFPRLPHSETVNVLRESRILAMTSRWEGLPTTAIEAPLADALVVGFDIPSLREVLNITADSCLVGDRSPVALARRIEHFLINVDAYQATVSTQKSICLNDYSPSSMATRYLQVYETLCSNEEVSTLRLALFGGDKR